MRFPRASGILLHVSSLPNPFGIGDLGPSALQFVDFLEQAGQGIWQILPLGPPAHGNSPYSCYSAFAGNPLLISPQQMVDEGWIDDSDLPPFVRSERGETSVDFPAVTAYKQAIFEKAFDNFRTHRTAHDRFASFCDENAWWLDDFSRFEALMKHFGQTDWTRWPSDLVQRSEQAVAEWDEQLADEIEYSKFLQFLFASQWNRVKQYANARGIRIYGDMPIFVAHESADVWANQHIFALDADGKPTLVAGVPPDYFSATGQLWGNPQYRWDVLESTNFAWWTARFGCALQQFDLLRMDHFRGFESYWEIPADAATAESGRWREGPKEKPFEAARIALGELPIIAEDLGMITREVHELRDRLGFPGMRVLQFGFETKDDDFHRPNRYPEHSVAYTGTHDNETVMGWYLHRQTMGPKNQLLDEFVQGTVDVHLQLVQAVLNSASETAIVPLQDVLGLDNSARMNLPGKAKGNWQWRTQSSVLTDALALRLRQMTAASRRLPVG